jgi:hypothetical protein
MTLYAEIPNVFNHVNYRFDSHNGYDPAAGQAYISLVKLFPLLPWARVTLIHDRAGKAAHSSEARLSSGLRGWSTMIARPSVRALTDWQTLPGTITKATPCCGSIDLRSPYKCTVAAPG